MSSLSTCAADADASFDNMPDDIVSVVLGAVAVSARSPSDFLSATMVSKRFLELGMNIAGTNIAGARCFAVRAKSWCIGARRFLQRCAEAGNLDASYILGMILFYCLNSREDGAAKISFAASNGHQEAMYSLAVIMFNGSGGGEAQRDICSATALCARAASLGHVIALRELGFYMHDGYGCSRSITEGKRLVALAKSLEMAEALDPSGSLLGPKEHGKGGQPNLANLFMVEWFAAQNSTVRTAGSISPSAFAYAGEEIRMCFNMLCGRQETRPREFRRCVVCSTTIYCSRACQSRHWTTHHRRVCAPAPT